MSAESPRPLRKPAIYMPLFRGDFFREGDEILRRRIAVRELLCVGPQRLEEQVITDLIPECDQHE